MGLLPLYVQCRLHKDAEELRVLHEPLVKMWTVILDRERLAQAINRSLDCSKIMSSVGEWFVIMNSIAFRGLLISARFVLYCFIVGVVLTNLQ